MSSDGLSVEGLVGWPERVEDGEDDLMSSSPRQPVVLSDDAILLRPLEPGDAAPHVAGEDEASRRWLNEGHASTLEGTLHWIEENTQMWRDGGPRLAFGIRDAQTEELVGMVEANTDSLTLGLLPGEVNISYQVYAPYRGRGMATRAVRLLLEHLKSIPAAHTAAIQTEPGNPSSAHVAVRAGFCEAPNRRGKDGMTVHTRALDR